jgi:hypothetical protein
VAAVNVAETALAATFTDDGTVKTVGALFERATTIAVLEELERLIVQVVLALEVRLEEAHCNEVKVVGDAAAVNEIFADAVAPPNVPVTVAL